MIRRLWRCLRRARTHSPVCAVATDLADTLTLHAGDWIYVEPGYGGFRVVAATLRDGKFGAQTIFLCSHLGSAELLRADLDHALCTGARRFNGNKRQRERP